MKLLLFTLALTATVTIVSARSPITGIVADIFHEHGILSGGYLELAKEWSAYKAEHGKVYSNGLENYGRMMMYKKNKEMIAEHNRLAHQGHHSYFLKMNHFGDFTHMEFLATMNGFDMSLGKMNKTLESAATFIAPEGFDAPTEVDWRKKGAVTEVKDQGNCGSCWAFSTTGSLEGQHFRKTGKLVSLSEQQLVDCSNDLEYQESGCDGGSMGNAFIYIKENHGLDTEESYPYNGKDGICKFKKSSVGATDTGFVVVPMSEDALAMAIAAHGPGTQSKEILWL